MEQKEIFFYLSMCFGGLSIRVSTLDLHLVLVYNQTVILLLLTQTLTSENAATQMNSERVLTF